MPFCWDSENDWWKMVSEGAGMAGSEGEPFPRQVMTDSGGTDGGHYLIYTNPSFPSFLPHHVTPNSTTLITKWSIQ